MKEKDAQYYDTSAMLNNNWDINRSDEYLEIYPAYVCPVVLEELEHLKTTTTDSAKAAKIRRAVRAIVEDKTVSVDVTTKQSKVNRWLKRHGLEPTNDNKIIAYAAVNHCDLLTGDYLQDLIARTHGVQAIIMEPDEDDFVPSDEYTGYTTAEAVTEEEVHFMKDNLFTNEYLKAAEINGEFAIYRKNAVGEVDKINYSPINSRYLGKVAPRNPEQEMLFDMLQCPEIKVKVALGCYGSGKTLCMLAHAIDLVQRGKFDKIVFIRNNIQVKDTRDIGSLPGDQVEKIWAYLMPLADHIGGEEALTELIETGIIEPVHLGFLRGRDLRRSIIFCDECENLTKQHVQLILGRCAEGSEVWFAGDLRQTDHINFERNNGLLKLIYSLRGNPLFAMVKLSKSERGEVSKLADLLDEVKEYKDYGCRMEADISFNYK